MKPQILAAVLAVVHLLAGADAASPDEPVPAAAYRSVLPPAAGVAEQDIPWRQANEAVARFPRGHADLLKWEQGQARPAAPAASSSLPGKER